MKIEPLSRLSTNKETEDGDPNAETKTKRTILPKELLESVTRSVRTQFEQDEFVSVEPEDFVYPSKPEKERKDASHNAEDVFDISVLFSGVCIQLINSVYLIKSVCQQVWNRIVWHNAESTIPRWGVRRQS